MKKPAVGETDKLRVLTEDPELRALMEQYYAAKGGEGEPILKAFAEKADELHPDWRETVERAKRDGVILRALFVHAREEAMARPDLTERDRVTIGEVDAKFIMLFDVFLAASPAVKEGAFRLASAVQEIERMTRHKLAEIEKRDLQAIFATGLKVHKGGQKGGTSERRRRENRPWVPHATELEQVICAELPGASIGVAALEIVTRWKLDKPLPPGVRTLERFVSGLRKARKLWKRAE